MLPYARQVARLLWSHGEKRCCSVCRMPRRQAPRLLSSVTDSISAADAKDQRERTARITSESRLGPAGQVRTLLAENPPLIQAVRPPSPATTAVVPRTNLPRVRSPEQSKMRNAPTAAGVSFRSQRVSPDDLKRLVSAIPNYIVRISSGSSCYCKHCAYQRTVARTLRCMISEYAAFCTGGADGKVGKLKNTNLSATLEKYAPKEWPISSS